MVNVSDLLIGVDIGLLVYYFSIILKIKKLSMKEEIDNIMLENILQDEETRAELKEKQTGIWKQFNGRYKPKHELLKVELKYLTLFLILLNLSILIYLI